MLLAIAPCLLVAMTLCLLLASTLSPRPATAEVLINEYMALNRSTCPDLEGDYLDWIELHNGGAAIADLTGYSLSDDSDRIPGWTLPATLLLPGEHLLLYASGEDRRERIQHWETLIQQGENWRYRLGDAEPPSGWAGPEFDDADWSTGPSGFGYGDGNHATVITPTLSLYLRKTFSLDLRDPIEDVVRVISLHVDYDDGFVVYLNGVEIFRANVGLAGQPTPYDMLAYADLEASMVRGLPPTQFNLPPSVVPVLRAGENVLAIQVHNAAADSDDLSMTLFLTLGLDEVPVAPRGVPDMLELRSRHLHTDFKLDHEGETILLRDRLGRLVDRVDTGRMPLDVARGRYPDGSDTWHYFARPTPEAANREPGLSRLTVAPACTPGPGFRDGPVQVSLSTSTPGAAIHYTIDGTEPAPSTPRYAGPIQLQATTVLRARAFADDALPSSITSATYFMQETTTLPVVSLITDPTHLWDYETGIYALGPEASPRYPHFGANFWEEWERPVHVEYFTPDGHPGFHLDAGVRIHGGFSRAYPQKSLRILVRGIYGDDWIDYPLFAETGATRFKRLILRNAGTDWCRAHLRDALAQRLTADADLDRQAYAPALVYLNGEYWGVYNIRERPDEHYLTGHYELPPDQVDVIHGYYRRIAGDREAYTDLIDYIVHHDLAIDAHYDAVRERVDVDNFADYCVFETYVGNRDWPHNNIRCWRSRQAGGRWRWMLLDLDAGLGGVGDATFDMIDWATRPEGAQGEHPETTLLLRHLLRSARFRAMFLDRYADRLNSAFQPERVRATMVELARGIEPEMPRHFARWDEPFAHWAEEQALIEEYARERPAHVIRHLLDHFELDGTVQLALDVSPASSGSIQLTAIAIDSTWSGTYFMDVPVTLRAIPATGFAFAGWAGDGVELSSAGTITIQPVADTRLTATFAPAPGGVVINEISYRASTGCDAADWIELCNTARHEIDLAGWTLGDAEPSHAFTLPAGTRIAGGGYLVLCRDAAAFHTRHAGVENYLGDLGFGLSGDGESVRLLDAGGMVIDAVRYDDAPPWPTEATGAGSTLELLDARWDNARASSWAASIVPCGSPGLLNSVIEYSRRATLSVRLPDRLELFPPYPNPFNPTATLRIGMPVAGPVRISIYDSAGRLVRRLLDGPHPAGWFDVTWNGRDERGTQAASGVYFGRVTAGNEISFQKLLLLR